MRDENIPKKDKITAVKNLKTENGNCSAENMWMKMEENKRKINKEKNQKIIDQN